MRYKLCFAKIIIIALLVLTIDCQEIGDSCLFEGQRGTCNSIRSCPEAIAAIKQGKRPTLCFFVETTPVVCCVSGRTNAQTTPRPASTTGQTTSVTPNRPISTTSNTNGRCGPVSGVIDKKNGKKAWDKCIDIAELIFPCQAEQSLLIRPTYKRKDICSHRAVSLIVGGTPAERNEFPHMALLGYGDTSETATWECGGTLISDIWVMTAAHCLFKTHKNPVKYIRLGSPTVSDNLEPDYLYNVARAVQHPEYENRYNDIALLETDRRVLLNERVIPACLHTGNAVDDDKFLATGWGSVSYAAERSTSLLKVTLEKFVYEECVDVYSDSKGKLPNGLRDDTQLCAGHRTEMKDTCNGDSGGPLQIYNTGVNCTYLIVGITSFGRACGFTNVPAVYTRVSAFVPWIESIVWP